MTAARRVRELPMRADQVRVGDGILSRGGHYARVLSITTDPTLYRGLDSLGRSRILRRPVLRFELADGRSDWELPANVCDVLAVGR